MSIKATQPEDSAVVPYLPTYGRLPWATVLAYVQAANGGSPIIDPDYYIGHQPAAINMNSLNRIMSALATPSPQPAEAKTAAVERLRHAGAMLSNCAFNMAQRKPGEPLTDSDIRAFDESRKAWDAAIATQEGK
jgi:hypothetical protein